MNRQEFEKFISSPPFEKDIERFPTGDAKYQWPGAYRDITVELAWECWREATFAQGAQFEAQLAAAVHEIERLEQRLAAAEAKIPDKPLGVFSEGVWVFATTAQTFTAEDLDIAAFVKYRDYMKGGE